MNFSELTQDLQAQPHKPSSTLKSLVTPAQKEVPENLYRG